MNALVLEGTNRLSLRDISLTGSMGPSDVRIDVKTVGICGSDIHYYLHGAIGPFVVRAPMVLGHEASGVITEVGSDVVGLSPGDRVCMEPGIPDLSSRASKLGLYNLDPKVQFWATPPVHGCLTPSIIHPAAFTYRLPDSVSFAAGAMVEPLAVGMHAVVKAEIRPGDVALVSGCGPIGILTALAALAGGCSRVIITDVQQAKLDIAAKYENVLPVNVSDQRIDTFVAELTNGWGVDVVFEASGSSSAIENATRVVRPGGLIVLIGMPAAKVPVDIVEAQSKEITFKSIFRYANVYDRAIALLASGKINIDRLVTHRYPFDRSIEAFDFAATGNPSAVKIQIEFPDVIVGTGTA